MDERDLVGDANRRRFLKISGLAVLGGVIGAAPAWAGGSAGPSAAMSLPPAKPHLLLHNIHTGETGRCVIAGAEPDICEGLARASRLLRDHRSGDVHAIDPALLGLLHELAGDLQVAPEFDVISGYRSPATNALLRRQGRGVARRSYHMLGQAVDVRLRGVELEQLHRAALARRQGGVSLYSGPGFVHIDTGPVRTW